MERRLAAILAADVVGYSRLMGEDEAGTLATLKATRIELIDPKVAEHNGRIVKLMGDGALVEFPSVVDAVECAVDIQRALAAENANKLEKSRIDFRIGINLGDVIIDGDDIYGDGVNIAARLEALAEPGGICISRPVHTQIKGKIDLDFEDLGEQEVKNIAAPVRIFKVLLDAPVTDQAAMATPAVKRKVRWQLVAGVFAVFVIVAGVALWQRSWEPHEEPASIAAMAFPLPDKPSIAVLPFNNMSEDQSQEYFADGMTEDLITDLSKISGLFVIARNSSFSYKGQRVKVRQIAEEMGVRYVLEGSVRRAGDEVRINAQLIDATTGGHLWAERYDGTLEDIFDLQDQVTEQIVTALALELTDAERRQTPIETNNPEAYDAFLQGWEYYRRFTADDFVKAISYLERAVELDPKYSRAYAALASIYWESLRQGDLWFSRVSSDVLNPFLTTHDNAERYATLAMENPSPLAHRVASALHWDYRQFDAAIAEAEKAVVLEPNEPDGHVALAWANIFGGRPQEALTAVQMAMRHDPQHPGDYMYVLGMARLSLGQYEDAVTALQRALERSPEYTDVNIPLAVAFAQLGRQKDAETALKRYTEVFRRFANNVDGILGWWPFRREEDVRRFGGSLVQAGLCCADKLEEYIMRVRAGGTLE